MNSDQSAAYTFEVPAEQFVAVKAENNQNLWIGIFSGCSGKGGGIGFVHPVGGSFSKK